MVFQQGEVAAPLLYPLESSFFESPGLTESPEERWKEE